MQTCSPPSPQPSALNVARRFLLVAATLLTAAAPAQTLARPGWAGSGLTPETWWRHAVVYRLDSGPLPTLTQLPSLQAFGIDAVLLTPQSLQPPPTAAEPAPAPDPTTNSVISTGAQRSGETPVLSDAQLTTPNPSAEPANPDLPLSLDDFLFECSRLHIRVLIPLDLTPQPTAPGSGTDKVLALARSWLYRGAAGLVLTGLDKLDDKLDTPANLPTAAVPTTPAAKPRPIHLHHRSAPIHLAAPEPPLLTGLHTLLAQLPGQHILVGDFAPGIAPMPSLQLQIVALRPTPGSTPADAASRLAAFSTQSSPRPLLSLAEPSTPPSAFTPIDAALLLAVNQPTILDSSLLPLDLLAKVFPPLAPGAVPTTPATPAPPPPSPPPNVYGAFKPYIRNDANTAAERKRKAAAEKARQEAENIAFDTFPVQSAYDPISDTPEGFVAFYHRLIQLHRSNPALLDGDLHTLDTASQLALAWAAIRPGSPALLVACNPSNTPAALNLTAALRHLNVDRDMVRTLLHTAAATGVESLNAITLPPHSVYIGDLPSGYTYR